MAHKEEAVASLAAYGSPAPSAQRARMSAEVALDLVLCGVLLAGLSLLAEYLQPSLQRATLVTGLVGGALCVMWGVLGRRGTRCRTTAMGTLVVVACVFVHQAVQSWEAAAAIGSKGRMVAALMVVLAGFCVGMLANLARDAKGPQRDRFVGHEQERLAADGEPCEGRNERTL
jgi:hypothetical protein